MGWSLFEERLVKGKLGFFKKIENMDEGRMVREIYMSSTDHSSTHRELKRWKDKMELEENWEENTEKMIKKKIENIGHLKWKNGMEEKSTLRWYKHKEKIGRECWYTGDWGGKLFFKLRSGTLEVNGRNRDEEQQSCSFCGERKESIEHLIVECPGHEKERRTLNRELEIILGKEEWHRRKIELDRGLLTLTGMTKDHDKDKIVVKVKKFLTDSWKKRNPKQ